jgi:hypothetical protein
MFFPPAYALLNLKLEVGGSVDCLFKDILNTEIVLIVIIMWFRGLFLRASREIVHAFCFSHRERSLFASRATVGSNHNIASCSSRRCRRRVPLSSLCFLFRDLYRCY